MTPADLAARHPRLYHLTHRHNLACIRACGLLSASALLKKFGKSDTERQRIETERRATSLHLEYAGGCATISDNAPISMASLAGCLDNGLTPQDWLRELNRRVFFWVDEARLQKLILAKNNRGQEKSVLVLNTLTVAQAYSDKIELCAINSGATVRRAARRGTGTFTPLGRFSYEAWRALRGGRDSICEVTFTDAIPDVFSHVIEVRDVPASRV